MRRTFRRALLPGLVGLLLASNATFAQASVSSKGPEAPPDGELFQARLRYAAAIRSGTEQDLGPGLSYSGVTPNDLAFAGWWWGLLWRHLGLTASVQREGFALYDDGGVKVTGGSLLRASAAPTGRYSFGPVTLEAAAGYSFAQLPVFGSIDTPSLRTVARHAILLAARGLVALGPVTIEGRFEYPITVAMSTPTSTSTGLGAAGALRVNLFRTGPITWGLLAEAAWNQDSGTGENLTASQSVLRVGGGIDLKWQEEKLVAKYARVSVRVTGGGAPLANTTVGLSVGGARRELVTDAQGVAQAADVTPGSLVASVEAKGFLPGEQRAEAVAGQDLALTISLEKEPPKVGAIKVMVTSRVDGAPVAATVEWGGETRQTDTGGVLTIADLPPGPLALKLSAPGFTPGEEAASVVAGQTSEVKVTLVPEKKRLPATLNGHIRNVRGGKPIAATLEIKELKQTLTADAEGKFSVEIPGGKYTVKISAPKFITQTKQVTVRDGDQAIFNVELFPK
ncbi:MAG: carboxypeptidase regulatory-like domain-containing protein [Myxococcota bacterium]